MKPLPKEFWIVVTQWDCNPVTDLNPKGPLIHEGYLQTEDQARERAKMLVGKYGWAYVLRVEVPGNA